MAAQSLQIDLFCLAFSLKYTQLEFEWFNFILVSEMGTACSGAV